MVRKLGETLVKELEKQVKQVEKLIEEQIDDDDTLKGQSERCSRLKASAK